MADTFSTALAIRLPQTGAYNNTWGAILNADAFQLIDDAIAGLFPISIGSATAYSLGAMSQGNSCPTRGFCLQFTGTPSAAVTVTLPSSVVSKFYLIDNEDTGQTLTFTYGPSISTSSTVTVQAGEKHLIWCDGANVWDVVTSDQGTLAGIPSTDFARVSRTSAEVSASTIVRNVFTDVSNVYPFNAQTLPTGSTITLDPTNGNTQSITLTGNYTMGVPANAVDGAGIDLYVFQDGTGGRSITWNSVFLFEGGEQPSLSGVAGGIDNFSMKYNASVGKWLVKVAGGITTPAGASYPLTIAENTLNWKLSPRLGSVSSPITVTITVNTGIMVYADSPAEYAMDLSGLPSGSTVNLINNGYIIGRGGDGGGGGAVNQAGDNDYSWYPLPGGAGGGAIKGPGLSRTFNVTNGNGRIWGGGGGGGGAGTSSSDGSNAFASGCGGGGAGYGKGGIPNPLRADNIVGAPATLPAAGSPGIFDYTGAGTSGGAGSAGSLPSGGGGYSGTGGNGGDFGAAGSAGASPTGGSQITIAGAAGGTAGKAIELQGAAAPTVGGSVKGAVS